MFKEEYGSIVDQIQAAKTELEQKLNILIPFNKEAKDICCLYANRSGKHRHLHIQGLDSDKLDKNKFLVDVSYIYSDNCDDETWEFPADIVLDRALWDDYITARISQENAAKEKKEENLRTAAKQTEIQEAKAVLSRYGITTIDPGSEGKVY